MKNTNLLIVTLVAISATAFFYSCDKESIIDKAVGAKCVITDNGCGGSFETCATTTAIWYTYNGKKYTCASSTDCTEAATKLAIDMCGTGRTSQKNFDLKVQQILNTFPANSN
jgi:hypothetical protein